MLLESSFNPILQEAPEGGLWHWIGHSEARVHGCLLLLAGGMEGALVRVGWDQSLKQGLYSKSSRQTPGEPLWPSAVLLYTPIPAPGIVGSSQRKRTI